MNTVLDIVNILLLVSLVMVTYRLIVGPTLPDRAVAADQIAIHVVAFVAVYSIESDQPLLMDLTIVTALVGFLSLAVVGIYMERAARGKARVGSGD